MALSPAWNKALSSVAPYVALQRTDSGTATTPNDVPSPDDIFVAVMGVTGAGKSTFIKRVTGREDIAIGHGLTSETLQCKAYRFKEGPVNFAIIDTPGFNDTFLDDAAVLSELASFLQTTYQAKIKLTAILYLHPITNDRLEGSARDNLSMFRKLCGRDFYPNVILATNFWSEIDEFTGRRRERELEDNDDFWGAMVKGGSRVARLPEDRNGCVKLLMSLVKDDKKALQIQRELVDQQMSISNTEAGATAKNQVALQQLHEEFRQKIAAMTEDNRKKLQQQQTEFERLKKEQQENFEAQLLKHKEELAKAKQEQDALLREAAERSEKALHEQEELIRQTRSATEAIQAQVETLSLQASKEDVEHQRLERKRKHDIEWAAIAARSQGEAALFTNARSAGAVNAKVSQAWAKLWPRPSCKICNYILSAEAGYSCTECTNFDLCKECFETSPQCFDGHSSFKGQNWLDDTELAECRRALAPGRRRFRLPCDACQKMMEAGSMFAHCCSCNEDNYDICVECVIRGKTCLEPQHTLQLFRM